MSEVITMANGGNRDKTVELLEKVLAMQLHSLGVTQGEIARIVGKSKTWVNHLLKNVPDAMVRLK